MKRTLIFVFLMLTIASYAQERVNQSPLTFKSESQTLDSATFWEYDKYKGVWNSESNKLSVGSFENIKAVTMDINGTTIYALVMPTKTWGYEYPALKQGYYEYNIWRIFEIDAKTYKKLFKLTNTPTIFNVRESNVKKVEDVPYEIKKMVTQQFGGASTSQFGAFKATDGNIRFFFNFRLSDNWSDIRYFEVTEEQWNKLNIGR